MAQTFLVLHYCITKISRSNQGVCCDDAKVNPKAVKKNIVMQKIAKNVAGTAIFGEQILKTHEKNSGNCGRCIVYS